MKVTEVKGTITLADGSTSEFMIGRDGGWVQWGATRERLGQSVDAVEALKEGLISEDLLASEDEVKCRECGTPVDPDEDGMCPHCKSEQEAEELGVQWRRRG